MSRKFPTISPSGQERTKDCNELINVVKLPQGNKLCGFIRISQIICQSFPKYKTTLCCVELTICVRDLFTSVAQIE